MILTSTPVLEALAYLCQQIPLDKFVEVDEFGQPRAIVAVAV
jgi:hypothetical protein